MTDDILKFRQNSSIVKENQKYSEILKVFRHCWISGWVGEVLLEKNKTNF